MTAPWYGTIAAFDNGFFPDAADRSSVTLTVSLPIWNNGLREIGVAQARSAYDFAVSVRDDLRRAALAEQSS